MKNKKKLRNKKIIFELIDIVVSVYIQKQQRIKNKGGHTHKTEVLPMVYHHHHHRV